MKKKALFIVIAILVVIAAVLAVIVSNSMPKKEPCELIISENGTQTRVDLNSLKLIDVKGKRYSSRNGKAYGIAYRDGAVHECLYQKRCYENR